MLLKEVLFFQNQLHQLIQHCAFKMFVIYIIIALFNAPVVFGAQQGKCDQTPPQAKVLIPSKNKGTYKLTIETNQQIPFLFMPDQTYVVTLQTQNNAKPFRAFMITAEDPNVDNTHDLGPNLVDVGSLKTLDTEIGRKSRYSERCYSSVENTDSSDKYKIEIHWISPKQSYTSQKIRLRAMVAENEEVWYTGGDDLIVMMEKDNHPPLDSPPHPPSPTCNLCSEARYEVVFQGQWSRLKHPYHYPSKPDENGYSHMVGASHSYNYIMWKQGLKASDGLKLLAEQADVTEMEREIINAMSKENGTRTLIRGKRRHHPYMAEPSQALFRVDREHHMFSIAVAMRPSPDWFLGTSRFELCKEDEWLEYYEIPLFPWDAGTMDGVSYESTPTMTQPVDVVKRVEVGSFNRESPFYQKNLKDLAPFATLQVKRLDVYPIPEEDCHQDQEDNSKRNAEEGDEDTEEMEALDEPQAAESRQSEGTCSVSEWSDWSPCVPDNGICGRGLQTRKSIKNGSTYNNHISQTHQQIGSRSNCNEDDAVRVQNRHCSINC
ncbi:spondin-2-like isoform X2 [Galleria mellonella]|uniref:Spondin-2-like isoform X2 n=1 Tax=Galleria mellonella TaxID=7137 RepID=A0A6J1WYQ0_GALME|nr:spondin-2-like isoform X2 [Galleria mellonella]